MSRKSLQSSSWIFSPALFCLNEALSDNCLGQPYWYRCSCLPPQKCLEKSLSRDQFYYLSPTLLGFKQNHQRGARCFQRSQSNCSKIFHYYWRYFESCKFRKQLYRMPQIFFGKVTDRQCSIIYIKNHRSYVQTGHSTKSVWDMTIITPSYILTFSP